MSNLQQKPSKIHSFPGPLVWWQLPVIYKGYYFTCLRISFYYLSFGLQKYNKIIHLRKSYESEVLYF